DDERAIRLELADAVDRAGRVRAVQRVIARDEDRVRPGGLDRLANRSKGDGVAVDVGQDGDLGHQRSTPSFGMMKLSVASQATSPSTVAVPFPRPKRPPSFSMTISSRRVSPGDTTRLKRHSSMAANRPIRSPNPGCFAT